MKEKALNVKLRSPSHPLGVVSDKRRKMNAKKNFNVLETNPNHTTIFQQTLNVSHQFELSYRIKRTFFFL